MNKEEIRQKMFDVRLQMAMLSPTERENKEQILYNELKKLKHLYAMALFEEKEKEIDENDQHKRR